MLYSYHKVRIHVHIWRLKLIRLWYLDSYPCSDGTMQTDTTTDGHQFKWFTSGSLLGFVQLIFSNYYEINHLKVYKLQYIDGNLQKNVSNFPCLQMFFIYMCSYLLGYVLTWVAMVTEVVLCDGDISGDMAVQSWTQSLQSSGKTALIQDGENNRYQWLVFLTFQLPRINGNLCFKSSSFSRLLADVSQSKLTALVSFGNKKVAIAHLQNDVWKGLWHE